MKRYLVMTFCIISMGCTPQVHAQETQKLYDNFGESEELFTEFSFDELDQDAIDVGLDNLECVEAPSEFMVFIRRIFSPVAVVFISLCDGISEKWSNLKESIAGKDFCCHCYNHRYHPSLNKHK